MEFIAPKTPRPQECIFCTQPAAHRDDDYYIFYRGEHCYMMLNLYPYNSGHLMIAPYQHVESIEKLNSTTLTELMSQAQLALRALHLVMKPDGVNMGINEGKVAGAAYAEHMHFHIVPRWNGDPNLMPVVADVNAIPAHYANTYHKLKQALESL